MYKIVETTTQNGYTYCSESNDVLYSNQELAWEEIINTRHRVEVVEESREAIIHINSLWNVKYCVVEVSPEEEEEIRLWSYLSEQFGVRRNFKWFHIPVKDWWDIEEKKKSLMEEGDKIKLSYGYESWYSTGETIYLVFLMNRYYLVNLVDYTPSRSADKFSFLWCRLGEDTQPTWDRTLYCKRSNHN